MAIVPPRLTPAFLIDHRREKRLCESTVFEKAAEENIFTGLKKHCKKIADSPAYGGDLASNGRYRFYPYESHVIYYRERKNGIFIARVLDKRMLPEKHL